MLNGCRGAVDVRIGVICYDGAVVVLTLNARVIGATAGAAARVAAGDAAGDAADAAAL